MKRPIGPHREELANLVLRGRDRAFDDLGFHISGWNGAGDDCDEIGFDIYCGGYADVVRNTCVLTLPSADRVLTASVLAGVLRASAAAWEPDWGVATSHAHRKLIDAHSAKGAPRIGWITYLACQRGEVPPLPAPVLAESVEDKGTLIVLTSERFTASNPEHVALAEQVRERLEHAGLLKPIHSPAAWLHQAPHPERTRTCSEALGAEREPDTGSVPWLTWGLVRPRQTVCR